MNHEIAKCREQTCRAPIIYLTTKTGAQMPVDAEMVQPDDRMYDAAKGHVSHFKTCKAPNRFSKGKRT